MLRVLLILILACSPAFLLGQDHARKQKTIHSPQVLQAHGEEIYLCEIIAQDGAWMLRIKEVLRSSKQEAQTLVGTVIKPQQLPSLEFTDERSPACIYVVLRDDFANGSYARDGIVTRVIPAGFKKDGTPTEKFQREIDFLKQPMKLTKMAPKPDQDPKAIYVEEPQYPKALKKLKVQGTVEVEFVLRPDGSIESARAVDSPDPRLSALAEKAALQWKFRPAIRNGEAAPSRLRYPIKFEAE